jgi:hypothetical protein
MQAAGERAVAKKERQLEAERAAAAESGLRDAQAEARALRSRLVASDAALRARDAELDNAAGAAEAARRDADDAEAAAAALRGELRRAGAEAAGAATRLGAATALAECRAVEIEELRAQVAHAWQAREGAAASAAGETADTLKGLRAQCGQLQGELKTQARHP